LYISGKEYGRINSGFAMTRIMKINKCVFCVHINGYKSHCVHKNILLKEIDTDIFKTIPEWCPLPKITKRNSMPTIKTAPKNNLTEKKERVSLIPIELLTEMLCPCYEEGIIKYDRESWRDGFHTSVMMDACMRHISKFYYKGEDFDTETLETHGIKKSHLGAAIFCLINMYNTSMTRRELDDRFSIKRSTDFSEKEKARGTGSGGEKRISNSSFEDDNGNISGF